jgi:hypothetical protein
VPAVRGGSSSSAPVGMQTLRQCWVEPGDDHTSSLGRKFDTYLRAALSIGDLRWRRM